MKVNKNATEVSSFFVVAAPLALPAFFSFIFLLTVANTSGVLIYGPTVLAITISSTVVAFSDLGLRDFLLSKAAYKNNLSRPELLFYSATLNFILLTCAALLYAARYADDDLAYLLLLALLPEAYALGVFHKCLFLNYQRNLNLSGFSKTDVILKSVPPLLRITIFILLEDPLWAILVPSLFSFLAYGTWFFRDCLKDGRFAPVSSRAVESVSLVFSTISLWSPFTLSFISFFVYSSLDKLIITSLLGESELAIYMAAFSLISIGQIAVSAIWSIYMPRISRNPEAIQKKAFLITSLSAGLIAFLSYQTLAHFLFDLLYPPSFHESPGVLSLLSFYFIFRLPSVAYEIYWVAYERYGLFVKIRVFVGFLSLTANLLLIPKHGLMAPAATMVASELILLLILIIFELKWRK